MKLGDFSFRDIDKKIVLLNDKNIIKDTNINIPYYGVIYIDHNKGISLRIISDDNNSYIVGEGYIYRYDDIKDVDIEFIEEIPNKNLVESLIDNYYKDKDIIETRKLIVLDNFRLKSNPDIINITFIKNDKKENIWAKIVGYTDDGIVCSLINDSKLFNVSKGINVAVKYNENENIIEVIGRIDL